MAPGVSNSQEPLDRWNMSMTLKVADLNRDGRSDLVVVQREPLGTRLSTGSAAGERHRIHGAAACESRGQLHSRWTSPILDRERDARSARGPWHQRSTACRCSPEMARARSRWASSWRHPVRGRGCRPWTSAATASSTSSAAASVRLWSGLVRANGAFGSPQSYAGDTYELVVADLTGDGNPDLMTARAGCMRGAGNGSFSAPEPVNIWFHDAAPVDYDRDGRMDLVVVNYYHTMDPLRRARRGAPTSRLSPSPDRTTRSATRAQFDER